MVCGSSKENLRSVTVFRNSFCVSFNKRIGGSSRRRNFTHSESLTFNQRRPDAALKNTIRRFGISSISFFICGKSSTQQRPMKPTVNIVLCLLCMFSLHYTLLSNIVGSSTKNMFGIVVRLVDFSK